MPRSLLGRFPLQVLTPEGPLYVAGGVQPGAGAGGMTALGLSPAQIEATAAGGTVAAAFGLIRAFFQGARPGRALAAGADAASRDITTRVTATVLTRVLERVAPKLAAAAHADRSLVAALASGRALACGGAGEGLKAAARGGTREVARAVGKKVAEEGARSAARVGFSATARAVARGNAVWALAGALVDQAVDTVRVCTGQIDGREYGVRSGENVLGAGGGLGGAALGAAAGTAIFPGVGTIVGGLLGGLTGSSGARWAVRRAFR